ncbi:hypothetical protein DPMN_138400 [Dreissena polymorpha]|uniref:Uncharacterized protein n=1 Tax=Dreissena polymorpha TaxID=45954 RepID=A0A9D4JIJ0_DREPO|nr:hypothetical protein DPMN_138400 [Dreissena polymorpha]
MEAQISDISPQENTYSHYQDISDESNRSSGNASTVTINPAGNNQTNASTLRAGTTLGKEKKPLVFMALAEINITDGNMIA